MKIILASSISPLSAREELHWSQAISKQLSDKDHQVDLFTLPIVSDPLLLPEQFMALRLLSIDPDCDMLITIGYPAYALRHPKKRSLLFSLASTLHEWFDSEYGVLATPQYHALRRSIQMAEKNCLAEASRIVCGSARLAAQLRDEYKLKSSSRILDDVFEDEGGNCLPAQELWIVTELTLEPCDRYDLLLDTVAHSSGKWKLAVFVPSVSTVYQDAFVQRIEKLAIKERVTVINAPLSTATLKKSIFYMTLRYHSTRIPESTIRAIKSNTPIIVLSDGGALLEVVKHNVNGMVLKPNAKSVAQALDQTCMNVTLVEKLSKGNLDYVNRFATVEKVLGELAG